MNKTFLLSGVLLKTRFNLLARFPTKDEIVRGWSWTLKVNVFIDKVVFGLAGLIERLVVKR